MKKYIITVMFLAVSLQSVCAVVISAKPWSIIGRNIGVDIDSDDVLDLRLRGEDWACTHGFIEVNGVVQSNCRHFPFAIIGSDSIEFLVSQGGSQVPLSLNLGSVLNSSSGNWVQLPYGNSFVFPEDNESPIYRIGFRKKLADGDAQYGWIEFSRDTTVFTPIDGIGFYGMFISDPYVSNIYFSDLPTEQLTVIPEPSSVTLLSLAASFLLFRRRAV